MFKFLLILFIIAYVVSKIGSMFFRAGAASNQRRANQGNVNVNQPPPAEKRSGKIKGGDYIDYEEVK